ncbi:MAG: DUF4139 domain-containing protein [Polyangiales bacterium]
MLVAASLLGGCRGAEAPKKPEWSGPVRPARSTAADRESVSITVYNSNFGLVREVRHLALPTGRVNLEFRDVSATIQPETVHVRSMLGDDALGIYEQDYRYDLLSPAKLLEKYVGKHVTLHRWNKVLARDEDFDAEVLSVEGGSPVYRIGADITYGFPGRVSFPEVPANLIAKPTLVWLLGNSLPKQKLEVTYLAQAMTWHADYVLSIADDPKSPSAPLTGDLQAWVTLSNQSGASYEHASLKLVAGDVQHFAQQAPGDGDAAGLEMDKSTKEEKPSFKEEGFFEYHLYSLDQPTDLLDNEQKQLSLLEGHGIRVDKKLIFSGQSYWYREGYGGAMLSQNQKVGVFLDLENRERNHLGVPLPKGIVRVYKADSSGAKQFIGEDAIDHTPRDEKLRVKMGEAFDVVADRKQTDWKPLGTCTSESAWEVSVRNHKDSAEKVELDEPMGGDWTIVSSSHPPQKRDQQTLVFDVNVPAKGETKVTWRVRVRWC